MQKHDATHISFSPIEERFYRMLSPFALSYASSFLQEEERHLLQLIKKLPVIGNMNFVVIGAGPLTYLRLGAAYAKKYIAVDPCLDYFINDSMRYLADSTSNVALVKKPFNQLQRSDVGQERCLFVFLFNVISYLENPLATIHQLARPGDILFVSTWNETDTARHTMERYFAYVDNQESYITVENLVRQKALKKFSEEFLTTFSRVETVKGDITESAIIYL